MPITPLPTPPSPTDTPSEFNTKAFASWAALQTFVPEANALANDVENDAATATTQAGISTTKAAEAAASAAAALASKNAAAVSEGNALTYAQAAGASAGVPTPVANRVLATNGSAAVGWTDLATLPAMVAKADKDGAVVTRLSTNRIAYAPSASATQSIDVALAGEFQLTPAGALTITFANIPAGNVSFVLTLDCINFGGKTITWPAGNWVKADGSFATAVSNSGVSWQTAGTDFVLVWFKNGTLYYKVMR